MDYYRPEDVVAISLAILVVMLIPVMIWSLWRAWIGKLPAKWTKPPAPPPLPKVGLGSLFMQMPDVTNLILVAREIELRMHRASREAKTVADEQRYMIALEILKELTPECKPAGVLRLRERLEAAE